MRRSAFLRLFVFALPALLAGCAPPGPANFLEARKGKLDLHKWRFDTDGNISLDGDWAFYPDTLITPQSIVQLQAGSKGFKPPRYVAAPASWTDIGFTKDGLATYQLQIQLPVNRPQLALQVQGIYIAYRLYVNGRLLHNNGLDTTLTTTAITPSLRPQTLFFDVVGNQLDLVIQVANNGYYKGGMIKTPTLGSSANILHSEIVSYAIYLTSLGAFFIMVFYHLVLYWYHTKDVASLLFALLCFVVFIRTLCTDQEFIYVLYPAIDFDLKTRVFYLTQFLVIPIYILNLRELFPRRTPRWLVLGNLLLGGMFVLLEIVMPYKLYTQSLQYNVMLVFANLAIVLYILVFSVGVRHNREVRILAVGLLVMTFFILNDVLYNIGVKLTDRGDLGQFGLLAFFIANSYIIARRIAAALTRAEDINQNLENKVMARTEEITRKNTELEDAAANIRARQAELQEMNQQMMASIQVASRIQRAVLPQAEPMARAFADMFVLLRPREVVSGDFYWFLEQDEWVFWAAADCTGQGVPGAFYSLVTESLLTDIVRDRGVTMPEEALGQLDAELRHKLREDFADRDEGVDIGLVAYNRTQRKVYFAGAYVGLYYFQNGELQECKAERASVGLGLGGKPVQYTRHELALDKPTELYLLTDGFTDQLGGEKNNKFGHPRTKKLLQEIHAQPMESQKERLENAFKEWAGGKRQQDDWLVMGVRLVP